MLFHLLKDDFDGLRVAAEHLDLESKPLLEEVQLAKERGARVSAELMPSPLHRRSQRRSKDMDQCEMLTLSLRFWFCFMSFMIA